MIKQILFISSIFMVLSLVCDKPQRKGWITFDALSARDDVTKVFQDINKQVTQSNTYTTTVNGTQYTIANLTGQTYYQDTFQVDSYVSEQIANVSGGVTTLAVHFNYNFNNTNGSASGHLHFDNFWFSKKLISLDGFLTWTPSKINNLTLNSSITISSSTPKLSDQAKIAFQQIINNHAQQPNKLKQEMINQINFLYMVILTKSLESEDIISINNVTYNYKNVQFNYTSTLHSYKLQNGDFKGLSYEFLYQLQNYTKHCSDLPTSFNESFGGVQTHNGFSWVQSTFRKGASQGLFNTVLGPSWDSNMFQFYMGDVANVMEKAKNYTPNKPVTGTCDVNLTGQLIIAMSQTNTIGAALPYVCKLFIDNTTLIQTITFTASFYVQISLSSQYLITHIDHAIVGFLTFNKQGDFVITHQGLASQIIKNSLASLIKSNTLGNKFQTIRRNRGAISINENYLTMYDPSQI